MYTVTHSHRTKILIILSLLTCKLSLEQCLHCKASMFTIEPCTYYGLVYHSLTIIKDITMIHFTRENIILSIFWYITFWLFIVALLTGITHIDTPLFTPMPNTHIHTYQYTPHSV